MRRSLRLSTQTLALQLAVVVATLLIAGTAFVYVNAKQLHRQFGERTLAIAEAVASLPSVREAFDDPDPAARLQPLAEAIREASGMSFVVIANAEGIRYSHPNPERLGERVSTDPSEALAGVSGIYTQVGTLGPSVRGKTPIHGEDGGIIGLVSVGVLMEHVAAGRLAQLPEYLLYLGVALSLGTFGSFLLARRVRRQTFGLEPDEMATLYEQREAMLLAIREGLVAVGRDGKVTLVNAEAQRLLVLDPSCAGRPVHDVAPEGRVRDLLEGRLDARDAVVLSGDRVLLVNRMSVQVRGEEIGSVVTVRDRTELETLMRELDSVRGLADALRAQAHEFSNRLHTVAGLIQLGRNDEAVRFITSATRMHQDLIETLSERVGDPVVIALLLAKAAVASERGIELRISDDTLCRVSEGQSEELVTVLGNLIDNAFDALAGAPGRPRLVEVAVRDELGGTHVRVRDSGPGVDPPLVDDIFREGFTTKTSDAGAARGIGLALVQQVASRRGGSVEISNRNGAVFTVFLPRRPAPSSREMALST